MRLTVPLVIVFSVSILMIVQIMVLHAKTTVVSFDKRKVQGQLIRQLAEHHASKAQVSKASLKFKTVLQKTLALYSKANHALIVDRQFVLVGGVDVTDAVAKQLAQAMREVP